MFVTARYSLSRVRSSKIRDKTFNRFGEKSHLMSSIPSRNGHDELACPDCGTKLVRKKAPFYLHDKFVGDFESIVCDKCGYSLLTSAGYDSAVKEACRQGHVGPPEKKGRAIPSKAKSS
jgi:DNA-directed RNA polymerase subunit RPC12/RpoP